MARTLVKLCGITRVADAVAAARLGADMIGMVLHADSPRCIPTARAREIRKALPAGVRTVGLFVDAPVELIQTLATKLGLDAVQLYGTDSAEELAELAPLKLWRAIAVSGMLRHELQKLKAAMLLNPHAMVEALVLDAHDPHLPAATHVVPGGSGRPNDWAAIRAAQEQGQFDRLPPLVAAGGLRPDNVAEVVRTIRPWAVDVSSGVEESVKGIKSKTKIEQFIAAVRAADEAD